MFVRSDFSFSLAATPNFCSSSMISSPKSCHLMVFPIILCVPISMSIFPASKSSSSSFVSLALFSLLMYSMRTGRSFMRSLKVL